MKAPTARTGARMAAGVISTVLVVAWAPLTLAVIFAATVAGLSARYLVLTAVAAAWTRLRRRE